MTETDKRRQKPTFRTRSAIRAEANTNLVFFTPTTLV